MRTFCRLLICGVLLLLSILASASNLLPLEQDNIRVFRQISPYVVNVHRLQSVATSFFSSQTVATGVGSGFIWNRDGYVITNAHVAGHEKMLAVTLASGKVVKARLIAADRRRDIAVLKLVSTRDLPDAIAKDHIPLFDSDHLTVGQLAIAIGNPFGLTQTFTEGVVSALNRDVMSAGIINTAAMIQTDASINPGNSGGPLLDSSGQLIGMNTLIFSQSGTSSGIGFAIPSNVIKSTMDEVLRNGHITQPGIGIVPVTDLITKQLGLPGIVISNVIPGSPAAKAGLRGISYNPFGQLALGDVIIGVNNIPLKSVSQFFQFLDKTGINKTIMLHIYRDNRQHQVKLKIVNLG